MRERLLKIFTFLENTPLTLGTWIVTFTSIVVGRLLLEHFFLHFPGYYADHFFYHFTHEFLSFLATFLLALFVVRFAGGVDIKRASSFLLFGFLILWSVPISEAIISHGKGFWSFYTFDSLPGLIHRYFTFFGDKPQVGTTYGVRIEIACAVLLVTLYTFIKSRSFPKSALIAILLYTILFCLGSFPAIVTIFLEGWQHGFMSVNDTDVAKLMLSPTTLYGIAPPDILSALNVKMSLIFGLVDIVLVFFFLFFFFRSYLIALLKNARFPQLIYHGGLFLLGGLFTLTYGGTTFTLDLFHSAGLILMLAAVECSWLASVIVNDVHDTKIDSVTNNTRPLPTGSIPLPLYRTIGFLFFSASLLFSALVSTQMAFLLLAYQALAWLYSAWPLRLKRFPILATLLAAAASLLIFFSGFIVFSVSKNILLLPWQIPAFLFMAYVLLLPIKDFKDIEGDRADHVYTIPVMLGDLWAKRLLGTLLFLLFIASVFVLRVTHLFWLAFLFGSLAYWILQASTAKHRTFPYRYLSGWYVALAFLYGLFLFFALGG